ncbi:MAG: uroporphyrinogen decarboxylase family protein [Armatimonadota bacterium]
MSYEDGWAAINLEMPRRIPRTEYSAAGHWDLVKAVTGIDVCVESPGDVKSRASNAFMRAWNLDLFFGTLIGSGEFGETHTDMGHAEYAAGGVDRRDTVYCPFEDPEEVLSFDPWEAFGEKDKQSLVRRFEDHYRSGCKARDFGVNMTGVYVTLVSGFIGIFGWEMLLLAAGTDLERFGALANRYASWMQQYCDALAEADVPVVMMHDDMVWTEGAIFNPEWYREYVFPNYRKYLAPVIESGKKVLFCSDGDFTEFVDDLVQVGIHGFVFEPLTSLEYIVEKYGQTHVIVGNADTRILLSGTQADIRAEVERCMSLGRKCPGFFMAVGNHIPANTPVESAIYYNDVYEELCRR